MHNAISIGVALLHVLPAPPAPRQGPRPPSSLAALLRTPGELSRVTDTDERVLERPFVLEYERVLPDGRVELTGVYRVRVHLIMPDGQVRERVGMAVCLDQHKPGDRLLPGECQKWTWAVSVWNYMAAFDFSIAAGVVGAAVGSRLLGSP